MNKEKWYYDACTLDHDKITYAEIVNKNYPKDAFISHLALGEAYGNCCEKGKEAADAFIGLINKLKDHIHIIGNDGIDTIFKEVRDHFTRLSITDAMHLATAITHNCKIFRTIDPDFCGISKKDMRSLAKKLNTTIVICKMVGKR